MRLTKEDMKRFTFNNCVFYVPDEVYEPAEDSFLLAEILDVKDDDIVLDIGTGCGLLAILVAKRVKKVVATDINPYAVSCTQMNAKRNNVLAKMDIRCGNLFEPIKKSEKFDAIIFNAPYLPTNKSEKKNWIDNAWAGGENGRDIIDPFIYEAPKHLKKQGRIFLVQSSLSNIERTIQRFKECGLDAKVVAEKKFPFETIIVIIAVFH